MGTIKEEKDWRELKKPEGWFGFSYVYFLILVTAVGLMYLFNVTTIGKNAIDPVLPVDSAGFARDIPYQSARVLPPVDVMKAAGTTSDAVDRGRELFKTNCVSCHGATGEGDGPTAPTLNPKPRNFHSLAGWTNGSKITQIYKTLQDGVPGTGMASYNYMAPADRFALIHFIRSLAPGQLMDSTADLKKLDETYNLSKGMNIPGQIPVRTALRIIEQETAPDTTIVHSMIADADTLSGPDADLLKRVTNDDVKVMSVALKLQDSTNTAEEFVRRVTASPVQEGFNAGVVRLSREEWMELFRVLRTVGRKETGK